MEYLCKPEKDEPSHMFGDEDDLKVVPDPATTTTNDQISNSSSNPTSTQAANQGNNFLGSPGSQDQSSGSTKIDNSVRALRDEDFIGCMGNLLDDAFHNNAQRAKLAGPTQSRLDTKTRTSKQKVLKSEQKSQLGQLMRLQGQPLQPRPYDTKHTLIGLSWAKIDGASGTRMDATKNKVQQGETMKTSAGLVRIQSEFL